MPLDLFAGLIVSDLDTAVAWYERLLGTDTSFRPDDTEAVWQLDDHRFVYLKIGQGAPGGGLATILVEDLDEFLSRAAARGVVPDDREDYGDGVIKAIFHDPDGNEFGVGTVPTEKR